jgi:hypothetical protein
MQLFLPACIVCFYKDNVKHDHVSFDLISIDLKSI